MLRKHAVLQAIGLTAFIFGLLIWVYVILLQVTHPEWVASPFSHVNFFPFNWRVDEVGMTAFAVAIAGFFVWRIELNLNR